METQHPGNIFWGDWTYGLYHYIKQNAGDFMFTIKQDMYLPGTWRCPLFFALTPPKQGFFQSKQGQNKGHLGSRYIIYSTSGQIWTYSTNVHFPKKKSGSSPRLLLVVGPPKLREYEKGPVFHKKKNIKRWSEIKTGFNTPSKYLHTKQSESLTRWAPSQSS